MISDYLIESTKLLLILTVRLGGMALLSVGLRKLYGYW